MTNLQRPAAAVLLVVVTASLAGPAVAAAAGNSTSGNATDTATSTARTELTPVASNPTNYSIRELSKRGTTQAGAPPSMRFLSQFGSATLRHSPVGPFAAEWKYVKPGQTTVNTNQITLRTVRLAAEDEIQEDLTVHVVAWQQGTTSVVRGNKTVERPAATNVTHRTHEITLGRGYDNATVPLPPNYAGKQQITMWVEEYPDARWVFDHHSIPAAQAVSVDDRGDLWMWAAKNILLVAVPGVLLSTVVSRRMIEQTAAGPMKGAGWWGLMGGLALFLVALFAWFETALLLAHVPQLIGGAIAAIVFVAMLESNGRPHEWVLFERHELTDAKNPLGDDVQDAIYEEGEELRTVRHDDGSLRIVKPGIFPFLARFFADPAKLPEENLKTQVEYKDSKWQRKYLADPLSEQAIDWTPAHWEFDLGLIDPETKRTVNGEEETIPIYERVNYVTILKGVGSLAIGRAIGATISLPTLGLALGALGIVAMSLHARDGYPEYQPAPVHMHRSEASLTTHRNEYSAAKSYQKADKQRWLAEARNVEEIRKHAARRDATMSQQLNRGTAGLDLDEDPLNSGDRTNGDGTDQDDDPTIKLLEEDDD